jgi:hypothetical protein
LTIRYRQADTLLFSLGPHLFRQVATALLWQIVTLPLSQMDAPCAAIGGHVALSPC